MLLVIDGGYFNEGNLDNSITTTYAYILFIA